MFKNKIIIICLSLFLCLILVSCSVSTNTTEIEETAKEFITDLLTYNLNNAQEKSLGSIKFNIATMDNTNSSDYKILSISTNPILHKKNITTIHLTVEYLENEKSFNTQFYEINLIKQNQNKSNSLSKSLWKIYNMKLTDPLIKTNDKQKNNNNNEFFQDLLQEYLDLMNEDLSLATKNYLIGSARNMQEQTNNIITPEQHSLINTNINIKNTESLYSNKQNQISLFTLTNNDKEINVLIHFYLTQGMGWKICNVQQL